MNRKEKSKAVKKSIIEVLGSQGLSIPNTVDSKDFVKARINEINLLSKELDQAKYSTTRRTFQQLPRHMRRRAASYNIKRLPVRLRLKAIEESKNDAQKGKKSSKMKNCRRWRRRPSNLDTVASKKGWLETHLWHAKRCKMIDYWGFRISAHLNEKCLKSSYRSSINGALLHDMSYWHAFSANSFDMAKFKNDYGENAIYDLIIEENDIQICPIKIFIQSLAPALILLHPASIQTGILDHSAFKAFINSYSVEIISVTDLVGIFKLQGKMSASVISLVFASNPLTENISRLVCIDPRLGSRISQPISEINISDFINSSSCLKEKEINEMRSNLLLPENLSSDRQSSISFPVVITAKGHEYYVICPRNWARCIWYQMIKAKNVKVAGIEQIDLITFEQGKPVYPRDFVASPAYDVWSESERRRLQSIYDKKPPAKRPSYEKFGISSPFQKDFSGLGSLIKVYVEIEGRGVLNVFDEILTDEFELIGFITSASPSSLKRGRSFGIASIKKSALESDSGMKVLIQSYKSQETLKTAVLNKILL